MKITKKELREIVEEVATELGLLEGLTKAQEKLPEPLKKAILKKQEEDEANNESLQEGNAWGAAIKKARDENLKEFEFNGKKYKLTEKKKKVNEETSEDDIEEFVGNQEDVEEGNAFGAAVTKAKEEGESEFEVDGKVYKVKEVVCPECGCETCESNCDEKDEDVEEGNAFGAAVTKAKEEGETEFEVDGKTYKVRENWSKITLSEKLDRILGNKKVL